MDNPTESESTPSAGQRRGTASHTVPERVVVFLQASAPRGYCDDCIAAALDLRREQVYNVTSTLGLCREYSRGSVVCAGCSRETKFATNYIGGDRGT